MTKIQDSILRIILRSDTHMTAEQVLVAVKQVHLSASLSTVYRNLSLFAEAGKIRRIQRATGADFFERNIEPHDHAYCIKCGRVMDLSIPALGEFLSSHFAHPILSFDLVVNYMCLDCKNQQNEP